MPIPLIPLAIAAVVAVATAGGVGALFARLAGQRIALLGGRRVGRSSLLRYLSTGTVSGGAGPNPVGRGGIMVCKPQIGGRRVKFAVDTPQGSGLGLPDWRAAFMNADLVWYLFRADLIASEDPEEVDRVRKHVDLMVAWLASMKKKPKIVLIGTRADQAAEWHGDPQGFLDAVRLAEPLKLGAVKLGNASVVVGSLASDSDAEQLLGNL